MSHLGPDMQTSECLRFYSVCLSTAMNPCLEMGGEKDDFILMMAGSEICHTSGHFVPMVSSCHKHSCAECAEICTEYADDCEGIGGMEGCVDASRRCAESRRSMVA